MGGVKRSAFYDDEKDSYDKLGTILEIGGMAAGAFMAPGGPTTAAAIKNAMSGMGTGAGLGRMLGGYINPSRSRGRRAVGEGMNLAAAGAQGMAKGAKDSRIHAIAELARTMGGAKSPLGLDPRGGIPSNDRLESFIYNMQQSGRPWFEVYNAIGGHLKGLGIAPDSGYDGALRLLGTNLNLPAFSANPRPGLKPGLNME